MRFNRLHTYGDNETDHGPLVPHVCPLCRHRGFNLSSTRSGILLLDVFGLGAGWVIRCPNCGHALHVPADQVMAVKELKLQSDAFQAGKLTKIQFAEVLAGVSLPCLQELEEAARTWTCTSCDEEVPLTFVVCWKCEAERPDADGLPESADELDRFLETVSRGADPVLGPARRLEQGEHAEDTDQESGRGE